MRLTCPNCDAQYEVDDRAIPEEGRDVQCSNCGHAWFQLPPHVEERLREDDANYGDATPAAEPEHEPAPKTDATTKAAEAESKPAVEEQPAATEDSHEPAAEDEHDGQEPPPLNAPEAEPRRRELDETLRTMLREEAEREAEARRAEGSAIETQPDLGLAAPTPAMSSAEITRRRMARLRSPDDEDEDEAEDAVLEQTAGARRDLLPDIEEINSTLRATSERERNEVGAVAPAETPEQRRRGFRLGFGTILGIAVLLMLAYMMAPKIVARVPASEGIMRAYVAGVDKGRVWLDQMMQKAVTSMRSDETTGS